MDNISKETGQFTIRLASLNDREAIYRLRHEVYARELGQHALRDGGSLKDELDAFNLYLVAEWQGKIAGFISITPPGFGKYSVDKYIARSEFPLLFDENTHEVRLLTVLKPHRGQEAAFLLMYAAFRWVSANEGTRIIGIGRSELLELYRKVGMQSLEREIQAGAVSFELMSSEIGHLRKSVANHSELLNRLGRMIDWRLDFPFFEPAQCFHGGAFFEAVGNGFDRLERRHQIINADVLDAWFPPSPKVLAALQTDLGWLLQTSPPAGCEGLVRAIAEERGVPSDNILPGAGSSDLIFLALRQWLTPQSRVLLLDPTYGEYGHVLERVVHCRVERFALARTDGYQINLGALGKTLRRQFDLVVLVNPNSPTGRYVPQAEMKDLIRRTPAGTRVWVDETYLEYAAPGESLERFAAGSANVVICKSMSKVYALSGVRVAYLCGSSRIIEELRALTPPWAVSLPAQVAAVKALEDPDYYACRHAQTHGLRAELTEALAGFEGWEIVPGAANFLLCHLSENGPEAAEIVRRCRERGLFLRDAGAMGRGLGRHALRIAVKDAQTNRRMVAIFKAVLARPEQILARRNISVAQL